MITLSTQTRSRNAVVLALSAAALLLAGCAPAPEGKWQASATSIKGVNTTQTMEFKKDGTVTQTVAMPTGKITATGTYKTSGDKLALRFTTFESTTSAGSVTGQFGKNGDQEGTIKIQGDKMTMTLKGRPITLDRIKQ